MKPFTSAREQLFALTKAILKAVVLLLIVSLVIWTTHAASLKWLGAPLPELVYLIVLLVGAIAAAWYARRDYARSAQMSSAAKRRTTPAD